jgi:predicted helicase
MPDNDLCKRGNAHILCNYFPEYKERRNDWDSTPRLNVTRDFLTALGTQSPDKAVFYVYGILCSNAYLDAFEPALFTTAGDQPPRIPLPPDRELFDEITNLGEALALLEKHVADDDLYIEDQYRPILGKLGRDFRVSSFHIDEETESITLVGETGELVIRPVPREILEFQIGGYQVLQQWLKVHTHAYTRTALTQAHLKRLLHTLHSLREQIDIINRLDDLVRPLVAPLDQRADRP